MRSHHVVEGVGEVFVALPLIVEGVEKVWAFLLPLVFRYCCIVVGLISFPKSIQDCIFLQD